MYKYTLLLLALLLWSASHVQSTPVRRQSTGYAPVPAVCPATPVVRAANGVGSAEAAFIANRYTIASQNLAAWLATTVKNATCNSTAASKRSVQSRSDLVAARAASPDWSEWTDVDDDEGSSSSSKVSSSSSTSTKTKSSTTSTTTSTNALLTSTTVVSTSSVVSTSALLSATTKTSSMKSTSSSTSTTTNSGDPATSTGTSTTTTRLTSTTLTTSTSTSGLSTSSTLTTSAISTGSTTSTSTTSTTTSSTFNTTKTTTSASTTSSTTTTSTTTITSADSTTSSTSTSTVCSTEGFQPTAYPLIGLTTSGGGYRSLLSGAGVIQGFDARDSNTGVSGVYQSLTYEAGLSGGAWLLSSIAGNNWPTISSLQTGLWEQAFQDSVLIPDNLVAAGPAYVDITADILAKELAGFPPTLTDPYGRLLSYQLLYGNDGGVTVTTSGLTSLSNFTSFNVPYPIITALGVQTNEGECTPPPNGTQYEIHPYEFGSWDEGVTAFTQTHYLGSSLSGGSPTIAGVCVTNYDNQGYVLGTSSNLFNEICVAVPSVDVSQDSTDATILGLAEDLSVIVDTVHEVTTRDNYAVYPNPFYQYSPSTLVESQEDLFLVDGGEALQNNPIWPFLHRPMVDVLLVNDNSADTSANYPNGSEIYTTYQRATDESLTRMPVIPDVATFIADGLDTRPTFFGCHDADVITIIYLPNQDYTYDSGQSTAKLEYTVAETDAMIANGQQIASKGGDSGWPLCLACGIMKKAGGTLPSGCAACYTEYCYN